MKKEKNRMHLDPRTKLVLLVTVTTLMFSTSNQGIMNVVKPVLGLLPFVFLFVERQYKTGIQYFLLYAVCFLTERLALTCVGGLFSFVLLAVCAVMTRFAPGIMMAAFLIESTSVSEFIAAMERMHITDKITIPMSVIFRFLPTIREEYRAIADAMRMRGIRAGGKRSFLMLEYRLIPLMVSVVKIGDELSAAALTRALGAPVRRTNICDIGFRIQDVVLIALCALCFALFFLERWGFV